jgi:hypothetical protein
MNEFDVQLDAREIAAELDWLAYQYLAGELSDNDALAFEERLAVDQVAREALASAVALSQAIILAGEASPAHASTHRANLPARDGFWLKPAGWLAASAAAVLVMVTTLQLLWPANRGSESALDSSLLAAEWTEIRDLTEDAWGDAARSDTAENGWDGLAAMTAPEDISESNWLLTALAPQAELPGDNEVHQQ